MRKIKLYIKRAWAVILEKFHKEDCFVCGWGIARWQNEITLEGHIGVIGLRCNACEAKHNIGKGV
jgi:hypothetical protein